MEPVDPEPTRRFSDRAEDYARFRPDYPAAAIASILDGLPTPRDVGAQQPAEFTPGATTPTGAGVHTGSIPK